MSSIQLDINPNTTQQSFLGVRQSQQLPLELQIATFLPPLRLPLRSRLASQTFKLRYDGSLHITNKKAAYSKGKNIANDKYLQEFISEQNKIDKAARQQNTVDNINKKDQIYLSAKIGKMIKVKPQTIRPALKSIKDEFRIREESIQRYLSDPEILEDYKMLSYMGKGCFSIVSLAVNRESNKRFAIKTYAKIDEIEDYKFDNIYKEINHLNALEHTNIVGLYHVIKDKKKLLLIMEDGGKLSLAGLLRKCKTVPEPLAKSIFRQLVEGVRYCHQQNICHRDIKLENILVNEDHLVKIIDFGFSSKCNLKLTNYCGTPPYMAPEITMKTPYFGQPADMWALGILLYLMLFGKFPFRATSEKELYRIIQQGKFVMGEGISAQAKETVSKLLKCPIRERLTAQQASNLSWLK